MPEQRGRRLCPDQPDGIPHYVDRPRAQRCDQHREQRHRWSDANLYRRKQVPPLPPLPWNPEPLTPERRREALHQFADRNAAAIVQTVTHLRATIATLRQIRPALDAQARQHFDVGTARLEALANELSNIAAVMGWPPIAQSVAQATEGKQE